MTADCAYCEGPITGVPVVDPEAVLWLGDAAARFCSTECFTKDIDAAVQLAYP